MAAFTLAGGNVAAAADGLRPGTVRPTTAKRNSPPMNSAGVARFGKLLEEHDKDLAKVAAQLCVPVGTCLDHYYASWRPSDACKVQKRARRGAPPSPSGALPATGLLRHDSILRGERRAHRRAEDEVPATVGRGFAPEPAPPPPAW